MCDFELTFSCLYEILPTKRLLTVLKFFVLFFHCQFLPHGLLNVLSMAFEYHE